MRNPWLALTLLLVVYLFNFLDRTLIFILFPRIKAEMTFSDLELALLGSTSFVLFYTLLGVPFGRLADRVSRVKLIAAGLAVWSLFSGLTGLAEGFWGIFFCRVMVGVGEATLGPAAMSLISDWFEPRRRATVQSLFTMGIPLGAAAAFFLGGWIGEAHGWRTAFYALGFPGVALAGLMLLVPEPERGATEAKPPETKPDAAESSSLGADLRALLAEPALRWHLFGYACLAIAGNAISMWVPSLLARGHGAPLAQVGLVSALAMATTGALATGLGGAGADWFRARDAGGRMRFTALTALATAACWGVLLTASDLSVLYAALFGLAGLGLVWLGPAAADVHALVGPRLRGLGIAVYYLVVNLLGYGLAPPLIGRLSDTLGSAADPLQLRFALVVCPAACLVAAAALARGASLMRTHARIDAPAPHAGH
jgi:MFS family permease